MKDDYLQVPAYEKIPANNKQFLTEMLSIFRGPLDAGCTIAGGAMRALYRGDSMREYFYNDSNIKLSIKSRSRTWQPGDIDIFLPLTGTDSDHSHRMRTLEICKQFDERGELAWRSDAGFGLNSNVSPRKFPSLNSQAIRTPLGIKVQLIDHQKFCHDDPVGVLEAFDFVNSSVAVSMSGGEPILTIHKRWAEMEAAKTLDIKNATGPLLGSRIIKYMKRRGLTKLSEDSCDFLTGWLMRFLAPDGFDDCEYVVNHRIVESVMRLFESGCAPIDNVTLFLNKWEAVAKNDAHDPYQQWTKNVKTDWAYDFLMRKGNA